MARSNLIGATILLVAGWGCVWHRVASHDAARETLVARNRELASAIDASKHAASRKRALELQKEAFEEVAPAHARILPVAPLVTDEELLRDFQAMGDAAGIRILSITIVEVKP